MESRTVWHGLQHGTFTLSKIDCLRSSHREVCPDLSFHEVLYAQEKWWNSPEKGSARKRVDLFILSRPNEEKVWNSETTQQNKSGLFRVEQPHDLMKHAQICFVVEISEFHNFSSIGRERWNKSNRFLAEPFSGEFHSFSWTNTPKSGFTTLWSHLRQSIFGKLWVPCCSPSKTVQDTIPRPYSYL